MRSRILNRHVDFIDSFLVLVEERGAANVTLQALAERSDYSKATWYNHFASIEDLWADVTILNAMMQTTFFEECANARLLVDGRKLLLFAIYLRHSIDNPTIWKVATIHRMQSARTHVGAKAAALLDAEVGVRDAAAAILAVGVGSDLPEATSARRIDTVRALVSGFGNFAALGEQFRWSQPAPGPDMLHAVEVQMRDLGLVGDGRLDCEAVWDMATTIVSADGHDWRSIAARLFTTTVHPFGRATGG